MDDNPYAPPEADFDPPPEVDSDDELTRKRLLEHESSIKSLGGFYIIGSVILVLVALVSVFEPTPLPAKLLIGFLLLGVAALQFSAGLALQTFQRWTKIPVVILSAIGLFIAFPCGALINVYFLYLIFSRKGTEVFSDEYREVIAATPHIKQKTSALAWIFIAAIFIIVALMALSWMGIIGA